MENEGKEPQVYEVGYHIIPSVSPEEVAKTVQALQKLIVDEGGVVISEEMPKTMRLAYTFVKHVAGKNYKYDTTEFGWIKFEAPGAIVGKMEAMIGAETNILRHIIVKTIRENTMYGRHLAAVRATATAREADTQRREAAKKETAGPVSEAEVDKAIESMVSE